MALDHQNTPDQDEDPVSFMDQHRGKLFKQLSLWPLLRGSAMPF